MLAIIAVLSGPAYLHAQQTGGKSFSLGSVDFPTSVTGKAQQEFLTGVLALHSFWYPEAGDHFRKAQKLEPSFAMAYWGEAMTHDHPIWNQHEQAEGKEVLNRLDNQVENGTVSWSEREKAYVDAVRILYDSELSLNERRNRYSEAMNRLFDAHMELGNYQKACDMISTLVKLEAETRANGEDRGRIPSTLSSFTNQYKNNAGDSAPKCSEES